MKIATLKKCLGVGILLGACGFAQAQEAHTPWLAGNSPTISPATVQLPPTASTGTVRVGLLRVKYAVTVSATGPFAFTSGAGDKIFRVTQGTLLKVKAGRKVVKVGGKSFKGSVRIVPLESGTVLTLNGRRYRGEFLLKYGSGNRLDVIEVLPLEEYLYGVLPREVGPDWPLESLKAQAVVSRTFVISSLGGYASRGFDVTNDVFSQVYGGLEDETAETTRAVEESRGEILVGPEGKAVQAFFHSSCGGHTEEPRYVWKEASESADNLWVGVPDTYCKGDPHYSWRAEIKADTVRKRLRQKGYSLGSIKKISISRKSPSGRAWFVSVVAGKKEYKIPGNRFRIALGADEVRSTLFTDIHREKNTFVFEGVGWGHGVGLCQWGARGRALAGQKYKEILHTYYPKAKLVNSES